MIFKFIYSFIINIFKSREFVIFVLDNVLNNKIYLLNQFNKLKLFIFNNNKIVETTDYIHLDFSFANFLVTSEELKITEEKNTDQEDLNPKQTRLLNDFLNGKIIEKCEAEQFRQMIEDKEKRDRKTKTIASRPYDLINLNDFNELL